MIPVTCACGERLKAADECVGKRAECPQCGASVVVGQLAANASVEVVGPPPLISGPFAKAWAGVVLLLVSSAGFVIVRAWSTHAENVRLADSRAAKAMAGADSWMHRGTLADYDDTEKLLVEALDSGDITNHDDGIRKLSNLRMRRERLLNPPSPSPVVQTTAQQKAARPATDARQAGSVGSIVYMREDTLVGTTEESYGRLVQLSIAKDTEGIAELFLAGQAMLAKSGTKVRVIGRGFLLREIRILSGPCVGRSGFVAMEDVK